MLRSREVLRRVHPQFYLDQRQQLVSEAPVWQSGQPFSRSQQSWFVRSTCWERCMVSCSEDCSSSRREVRGNELMDGLLLLSCTLSSLSSVLRLCGGSPVCLALQEPLLARAGVALL